MIDWEEFMDKVILENLVKLWECELDMLTPGVDGKHPLYNRGLDFAFGPEVSARRKFLVRELATARELLKEAPL